MTTDMQPPHGGRVFRGIPGGRNPTGREAVRVPAATIRTGDVVESEDGHYRHVIRVDVRVTVHYSDGKADEFGAQEVERVE